MNLPLYDNGLASGLLIGILFGFILEGAGLASPRKLTGQFRLSDWTVFKVMLTAVIVAAIGLWLAEALGVIGAQAVFSPTVFFWATAIGGLLIGAGFAIGGYCPGTSAAGIATGRGDAGVFILGMLAGTWLFAAFFEPLEGLYLAARAPEGQDMGAFLGLPDWLIIAMLILMGALGWALAARLEAARGGPLSARDLAGHE
ncbi:MAG: YeeE/YedE thiosulfate transporter family protein [Alphaproteobacteria bacterium]